MTTPSCSSCRHWDPIDCICNLRRLLVCGAYTFKGKDVDDDRQLEFDFKPELSIDIDTTI